MHLDKSGTPIYFKNILKENFKQIQSGHIIDLIDMKAIAGFKKL